MREDNTPQLETRKPPEAQIRQDLTVCVRASVGRGAEAAMECEKKGESEKDLDMRPSLAGSCSKPQMQHKQPLECPLLPVGGDAPTQAALQAPEPPRHWTSTSGASRPGKQLACARLRTAHAAPLHSCQS